MNELLRINHQSEQPTVSARKLHEFIQADTPFRAWFPRMCKYSFVEGVDYTLYYFVHPRNKQPTLDYHLSISMAKGLCLIQNSEQAREARRYFLMLEDEWNTPEMLMSRALKLMDKKVCGLRATIAELQPKAQFYDAIAGSRSARPLEMAAKLLGFRDIGRSRLFAFLRNASILQNNNIPYQEYIDRGYFRIIESSYAKANGETEINIRTLIYKNGLDFVRRLLERAGYQPSMKLEGET